MITLPVPVFVALIVALLAIIGCGIWTGIRIVRRKTGSEYSYQLDIMVWIVAVVALPLLALALTATIQAAKQASAAKAEKTERTEALKAENDRKREERREKSGKAIRAARQAEEEDRQAALEQELMSYDWAGIQKVLQSRMSPHAKVEYVVNSLRQEGFSDEKKSCSLSEISISQYNRLMGMLHCQRDCDMLVSELARTLAICVDPLKADAYQDFLEQQRAGRYDPENYAEEEAAAFRITKRTGPMP